MNPIGGPHNRPPEHFNLLLFPLLQPSLRYDCFNNHKFPIVLKTVAIIIFWPTTCKRMRPSKFHPWNWERKRLQNLWTKWDLYRSIFTFRWVWSCPTKCHRSYGAVCHLYNFPEDKDINEVRCQRFISQIIKKINPETLPPTKNEFFLPMKRSNYEINDEINIPITPRNTASSRSWLSIKRRKNWSTMDRSAIQSIILEWN